MDSPEAPDEMHNSTDFAKVDASQRPGTLIDYLDWVQTLPSIIQQNRELLDLLDPQPGDAVLDAGCGVGHHVRAMAERMRHSGRVVGFDLSVTMLAEAQRRFIGPVVAYVGGDAAQLPFEPGSFDRCRAERLLLHVDDPVAVVRELVRVLRPGGRLLLNEPDWSSTTVSAGDAAITALMIDASATPKHPHIGQDLEGLVRDAGMRVLTVRRHRHVSTDGAEMIRDFEFGRAGDRAVSEGWTTQATVDNWLRALLAATEAGTFKGSTDLITVTADRPAA